MGTLPLVGNNYVQLGNASVNSTASGNNTIGQVVGDLAGSLGNTIADANNSNVVTALPVNTVTLDAGAALTYNVGMVKDHYFWYPSNHVNKFGDQSTIAPLSNMPTTIGDPLNDLWHKAGGHKGMIVRHNWAGGVSFSAQLPQSGAVGTNTPISGTRYGFQFHYNPTSITLSYSGVSDVDPMYLMSSANKFNTQSPAGLSQSQISFSVLLNRKADFKYYDSSGHLKPQAPRDLYSPRQPSTAEQEAIYKKGTMYDVEYLLGTLVGFELATSMRGTTTDIGFLIGAPIEVHLGSAMRYMGVIQSINVNHAFFDDRMVPTFTTVDISMSRMPDYQGE